MRGHADGIGRGDEGLTVSQTSGLTSFLSRVGIMQVVSPLVLEEVAGQLRRYQMQAGQAVVNEGLDAPDGMYFIEHGTVVVESRGQVVARLGPGEFFGEMALLDDRTRSATVRAETPVVIHQMGPEDFLSLVERVPALGEAARRAARLRGFALQQAEGGGERINLADLLASRDRLRIGRHPDNDVVLDSVLVSAHHAVLRKEGERYLVADVGSSNGTYVNGVQVSNAELKDGDVIWIADTRLVFDRRGNMTRVVEPKGIRIDAVGVRKEVKGGKNLLADISLSIQPGEFVAIVGGSGAGKSTLMDALSGVRPATGGRVLYNGEDFYPRRALYTHQLGYVPQDDIIHRDLPLRVTLDYAARLRLPPDVTAQERAQVVAGAIEQLGLAEQADIPVHRLSGGQRKRASIGVELLTQPRVFFLDEPTSGLDPATDASMMRLLRDLTNNGSTVVLTTHATRNVVLCDKVIFMTRGGNLAFVGPPARALEYFEVDDFDEIYTLLEDGVADHWRSRFLASDDHRRSVGSPSSAPQGGVATVEVPHGQRGIGLRLRQLRTLSRRNAELYLRNPGRTIPLFAQPVIFTLLLLALFRTGVFSADNDVLSAPTQLLFIYTFTVFLFGLLWGIQEIVSEFSIFKRERLVNLGVLPYVLSKLTFLVPVMCVGITVMMVLLRLFDRLPDGGFVEVYLPLWFTLFLMGMVGLALALMSSAIAPTSQAATDSLSIWIMPQVLFSGAIFPVPEMALPGRVISAIVPLRWGFEGVGHVIDLNAFYAASPSPIAQSLLLQYESSFSRDIIQNWGILALFILVPMTVAIVVLRRRTAV